MLWESQLLTKCDSGTFAEQLVGCFLDHSCEGVSIVAPPHFLLCCEEHQQFGSLSLLHFQM